MSQMNKTHLDEYLKALDYIQGWFYPEDVRLFQTLNELQGKDGVPGDLLEIGVYHGKSSILMGYFPRKDERLVRDFFEQSARTVANRALVKILVFQPESRAIREQLSPFSRPPACDCEMLFDPSYEDGQAVTNISFHSHRR